MSPIRPSKHAVLLDTLPTALQGVELLRQAGHGDIAGAFEIVADYARDNAQAEVNAAKKRPSTNRQISVTKGFKLRVHRLAKEEGASIPDIVRESIDDFLSGEWVPADPGPRAPRGAGARKASLNVRVPHDTWDDANAHGKDPEAKAARGGYELTAAEISIAALVERFGPATAEDEAAAALEE